MIVALELMSEERMCECYDPTYTLENKIPKRYEKYVKYICIKPKKPTCYCINVSIYQWYRSCNHFYRISNLHSRYWWQTQEQPRHWFCFDSTETPINLAQSSAGWHSGLIGTLILLVSTNKVVWSDWLNTLYTKTGVFLTQKQTE